MYYRLDKGVIHNHKYKGLDYGSIILYSLFYDRSILPEDSENVLVGPDGRRLFIIFSVDEMCAVMKCDDVNIIAGFLQQLTDAELINVVGQPDGKPPVIFVNHSDGSGLALMDNSTHKSEPVKPIIVMAEPEPHDIGEIGCNSSEAESTTNDTALCPEESDTKSVVANEPENTPAVNPKPESTSIIEAPANKSPHSEDSADSVKDNAVNANDDASGVKTEIKNNENSSLFNTRYTSIHAACKGEFSLHDTQTIWSYIVEKKCIEESRWDDFSYIFNWVSDKYNETLSRFGGGDSGTKFDGLMTIIGESSV
ncbi:MAG: replication initiator protein A [Oscillospiraceae bacterium]|nr:replication initiator protein A [Oscillospiraceae bacterium]MCL2277920.1 replication initiator protein A [Oscillospiraceae bacterium]